MYSKNIHRNTRMADTIIKLQEVMADTSLSRSSIYQMISEEKFPAQVKLSYRSVGWSRKQVNAWIEQKIEDSAIEGEVDNSSNSSFSA